MKNIAFKMIFSAIGVCFSTLVSATTCLPIQGTVQTQLLNEFEQVGQVTMTSTSPSAFKKVFGQMIIMGGIKGTITTQTNLTGKTVLEHQIGFPGVGSITSDNDVAQVTGVDSEGNLLITETVPITDTTAYSGAFAGWSGQLVAKGILNITTGTNTFIYTGKICHN